MSTSWNEANKQQVNPHVSTNLGSSQGDPNAPVNYIEFFPEAGDADFASLFPELMGMPIDSNNSLPASTSRQSLTMPENSTLPLQIGGASGNGRHDGTAGQPFLPSSQTTLSHTEGIQGLRSLVEDQVKQNLRAQMQIHSYHRRPVPIRLCMLNSSRSLSTPWLHSFAFVKINCQALALEENKRNVTLSGHTSGRRESVVPQYSQSLDFPVIIQSSPTYIIAANYANNGVYGLSRWPAMPSNGPVISTTINVLAVVPKGWSKDQLYASDRYSGIK
ncbi:hypothetical protein BKA70DRAFT_1238164 [Coprinopsis sp. MPI-PUGE-AT-0042]|nr:hypothetical protein BKA70DRAFT_1238164 [Coprinopsis sp. MPI-PUGE-AT-0042]